jgi:hypothetical protein
MLAAYTVCWLVTVLLLERRSLSVPKPNVAMFPACPRLCSGSLMELLMPLVAGC